MDKLNNVYLIFTGGHAWFGALVEGGVADGWSSDPSCDLSNFFKSCPE
ncbi:hypothetical protein [Novosphingobium sp.]